MLSEEEGGEGVGNAITALVDPLLARVRAEMKGHLTGYISIEVQPVGDGTVVATVRYSQGESWSFHILPGGAVGAVDMRYGPLRRPSIERAIASMRRFFIGAI